MSNKCVEFLNAFCTDYALEAYTDNACLEFDVFRGDLSKDEIEGQCVDWVMSFLVKR